MATVPAARAACGEPEPATGSYFVSAYPPFDAWSPAELPAWRAVLDRRPASGCPLGLYVHIPFCEKRCDYCYYLSYDGRHHEVDAYLDSLRRELALYEEAELVRGRGVDFAYIGGGTPSLLSPGRLRRLFEALALHLDLSRTRELTVECAPRSVTTDKLRMLRDFGVTRISLGVQQLDDDVLLANGRLHLVADVERALEAVREVGFAVVNLDLMVGLRGETEETFSRGLERTLGFEPESLTIYQLEIPHNTLLFRRVSRAEIAEIATWDEKRSRLDAALDRLEAAGYTLRSAYTAVRDPERHAFLYQDLQYHGADLLGVGASSFSYLGGVHQQNVASLGGYLARAPDELPLGRAHELSADERLVRRVVLQLKLGALDLAELRRDFCIDPLRRFASEISVLEAAGDLEVAGERIQLTRQGLLRIDRLLPLFYLPEHRPRYGYRP
jgi:oxygen-independent coproporphyrinogen-3 oxidase